MPAAQATHPGPNAHGTHAHPPVTWPKDQFMGRATALKVGMWIFLLSDAFSFAGLLITYGILRASSTLWQQPSEPHFGINFTAALTFLLICSSVTMVMAVAACQEGKRGRTLTFLGLTILGGLMFLCGQYHEYFGINGKAIVEAVAGQL